MKALTDEKTHGLETFAIKLAEVDEPTLREFDVLANVQAIGINPGDWAQSWAQEFNDESLNTAKLLKEWLLR